MLLLRVQAFFHTIFRIYRRLVIAESNINCVVRQWSYAILNVASDMSRKPFTMSFVVLFYVNIVQVQILFFLEII